MHMSMQIVPTMGQEVPPRRTDARPEQRRGYPSPYPMPNVAMRVRRGACQWAPYEIGVPAGTVLR